MDCSPPGSSVHGILQASILEWVAIRFFRGSSRRRDQTWVSPTAGRFFSVWAIISDTCHAGEPRNSHLGATQQNLSWLNPPPSPGRLVPSISGRMQVVRGETEGLVTWPGSWEVQCDGSRAKFHDNWEADKGWMKELVLCSSPTRGY